eukprot:9559015-Alexandrium_andersonii.AAC.1
MSSLTPALTTSTQESRLPTAGRRPCLSPPARPLAPSSRRWAGASTPGTARSPASPPPGHSWGQIPAASFRAGRSSPRRRYRR